MRPGLITRPFFEDKARAFWILQAIGWSGYLVLRTASSVSNNFSVEGLIAVTIEAITGYCLTMLLSALYGYYKNGVLKAEGNSITEGIGQGRITKNLEGAPIDDAFQISDQEALPIEEGDGGEVKAQRGIAAQGPRGVARQQVHLVGFQRGETLLGVERHVAHLVGVAQGAGGHGPADVHVQPLPLPLGIGRGKAGHAGADPTQDLAALLEGAQGFARAGESGPQGGTQEQGRREPLA